ncbi:MAG: hypothetical protein AAGL23_08120 [Pseudomonadota bacterium]
MNGPDNDDEIVDNQETRATEDVDHAKKLMIEARLRLAADMVQDLAYDLVGLESSKVVAELIEMSVTLQRLVERREAP